MAPTTDSPSQQSIMRGRLGHLHRLRIRNPNLPQCDTATSNELHVILQGGSDKIWWIHNFLSLGKIPLQSLAFSWSLKELWNHYKRVQTTLNPLTKPMLTFLATKNGHLITKRSSFPCSCLRLQGDHSPCAKPPVDFKTTVPLWPGQVRAGQAKTELLF